MVAHAFNPSTPEAETGGSLGVRGQPGLQELVQGRAPKPQRTPVSKNKKTNKQKEQNNTHIETQNQNLGLYAQNKVMVGRRQ